MKRRKTQNKEIKVWGFARDMALSSEERRRRVHRAVEARRRAENRENRDGRRFEAGAEERRKTEERTQGTEERRKTADNRQREHSRQSLQRSRKTRRSQKAVRLLPFILVVCVLAVLAAFGMTGVQKFLKNRAGTELQQADAGAEGGNGNAENGGSGANGGAQGADGASDSSEEDADASASQETEADALSAALSDADRLAAMYDYDGAIARLNENPELAAAPEAQEAAAQYEQVKTTLVRQDILTIPHIFFHILVVDTENAFDRSKWGKQADGYNSLMTTIPEFKKMLDVLYNDGFVLVGLHDMAEMQQQPDGSMKMVEKDIMLPEGKKALVMSEDDVCYYEYMEGAGFASRMIVGEDGRPTCVYTDSGGNEQTGAFDLVPILDEFIDEHPDFSYQGAKAILAFTGYNGILGYRTDETYDPNSPNYDSEKTANPNIEADRETVRQVVKALKDDGYELASHSWGHRDMGAISFEHLKKDTDRWDQNVNQELLNGECDIIIYPKGADVGDWHAYTHDNEKFDYLWNKGFRYFCNVDAAHPHWVQKGEDSLRQGRRPLDGLALWNDIANGKNRLSDLFPDVSAIFDSSRPTPVPEY